ncbi:sugar phosphate isomerase/epimerase family protein [Pelagovum pacificum]|uniref:Sugar phosphate isomerase/epimerase n=1 Tax=Pelagovum pacificum TaxID=2588711 RepID=A0A5C5GCK8_9RHOB|nr:sugar phosphate isomerase/epimerase family protein [Pelagovum pacificum]QQA41470.1 sugar phosphate isomerase/epimerase [Pelagovum pacificum]TNY31727.1 sugar phosphate isomerase/epimerase [Pelagovum pacificum]
MKLSFNTWVYSGFPVWVPSYPLEEVIRRLSRMGYDGIEIGAAAPHAFPDYLSRERIGEIAAILKDNGIACSSMLPAPGGGPGFNVASPDRAEREAALDQYKKVADLCAAWGSPTLIYVAGWQVFGTGRKQAWDWSREALAALSTHVGKDLTIVVEPTSSDSNLIDHCDDMIELIDQVCAPNVAAMFDTFHTHYRNEVPTDYVYRLGDRLKHIHLSDSDRDPPGSGVVDFPSLIEALKETGYDGYLTMEIGFNRRSVEPDDMARRSLSYLKSII